MAGAAAVMAAVEGAVMVLGADLRLRTANPAAEALLRRGDGLRLRDGRVRAACDRDARARAVRGARRGPDGRRVARPPSRSAGATGRPAHRARLFPLRRGGAAAIPVVEDPEATAPAWGTEADILARAFGLTGAEARLAARMAAGESLAAAADALGVARSTARTHLLRVFGKLDVRRRAELVRRVRDLGGLRLSPPA